MTQRQATDLVTYSIVNMDIDDDKVAEDFGNQVNVYPYPIEGVGGQVLPDALKYGTDLVPESKITVTVDPDAIVLADGWDAYLLGLFYGGTRLAGINPRSGSSHFRNVPEWNWMAFDTKWWQDEVGHFDPGRAGVHDIGHVLNNVVNARYKMTWPHKDNPFNGRAAAIVQDPNYGEFVFHAFYSTRKHEDPLPDSERNGILTDREEREAINYCVRGI